MRRDFGFNTDIFETNILNLLVVIGIVVTRVGDALRSQLAQRKERIQAIFRDVDQKADFAQQQLTDAMRLYELCGEQSKDIRAQGIHTLHREETDASEQLQEELARITEKKELSIRLVRYQEQKFILRIISNNAIMIAKEHCLRSFTPGKSNPKQKKFNMSYLRKR
jgi:F0F1-type ATP synthase membrane subunit b/b'